MIVCLYVDVLGARPGRLEARPFCPKINKLESLYINRPRLCGLGVVNKNRVDVKRGSLQEDE